MIRLSLMLALLASVGCAQRSDTVRVADGSQPTVSAPMVSAADAVPETVTPEQFPEPLRSEYKLSLAPGLPIDINNPHGDVRLRFNGYEHAFELSAVAQVPAGAAAFALEPVVGANSVAVKVQVADGAEAQPTQRVDIVVYVPEGHPVRVVTTRGQIEVRGVKSALTLLSSAGNIAVRGVSAPIDAETADGSIEVSMEASGHTSDQRLVTRTGVIIASFAPDWHGELELSTSALIATEYSVAIEPQPGQEPNKRARAKLGQGGKTLVIESKRGEIRLFRRAAYQTTGSS